MADHVLTVIPNVTLRAGLMGVKSRQFSLVITDRQIVFARMTTKRMKELTEHARGSTPTNAYGLLAQAYRQLSPEAILAEHPDNFAVSRNDVSKVKVKAGGAYDGGASNDLLLIVTSDKKYKLTLMGSAKAAREALATAGY